MTRSRLLSTRRARVAVLLGAGIMGFGGVAAAGLGGSAPEPEVSVVGEPVEDVLVEEPSVDEAVEDPAEDDVIEAPVIEAPVIEERVAQVPIDVDTAGDVPADAVLPASQVDDPATDFDETTCEPGPHGATVSRVARTPGRTSQEVQDAAHSSCGKALDDLDEPTDDVDEPADDVDEPTDDVDEPTDDVDDVDEPTDAVEDEDEDTDTDGDPAGQVVEPGEPGEAGGKAGGGGRAEHATSQGKGGGSGKSDKRGG